MTRAQLEVMNLPNIMKTAKDTIPGYVFAGQKKDVLIDMILNAVEANPAIAQEKAFVEDDCCCAAG